jgi:peroxiredoxin
MSLTPSSMLPLGTMAPPFKLPEVTSGQTVSLDDFAGRDVLLVMFICRHCPYVQHIEKELARIGRDYERKSLGIVAISANDADGYPEDAPPGLKTQTQTAGFGFPYLYDESQAVAKAYSAACTPDFFVFDKGRRLVYRGQLDDSRPGNGKPLTGNDLRAALDAVLIGQPIKIKQRPSTGCNIKWKPGTPPTLPH